MDRNRGRLGRQGGRKTNGDGETGLPTPRRLIEGGEHANAPNRLCNR